jgi:hypothetical protein
VSFSQQPAMEKDTENGAPGNSFGPSYFDTDLALLSMLTSELTDNLIFNVLQ